MRALGIGDHRLSHALRLFVQNVARLLNLRQFVRLFLRMGGKFIANHHRKHSGLRFYGLPWEQIRVR